MYNVRMDLWSKFNKTVQYYMFEDIVRTFIPMDITSMSYWESVEQRHAVVICEHLCVKLFLLTPEKQLFFHPGVGFCSGLIDRGIS